MPIDSARPLRVLWVATKAPRPAIDGGRLVMMLTLDALIAAGVEIFLVAPTVAEPDAAGVAGSRAELIDVQPRAWWNAGLISLRSGRPISVERHAHRAVASRVEGLVRRERFDLVHVEQVQALAGAQPALRAGLPCVLRAQSFGIAVGQQESQAPRGARFTSRLFRAEADRMRRFEAAALATADVTIALSAADAAMLATLNPAARVIVVPPPGMMPTPDAVPASTTTSKPALAGSPACVWIGSGGWAPNDDAGTWLLQEIWPAITARLPHARLHLFGSARPNASLANVDVHGVVPDSREAFAPDAILLLPLRTPAGVRMRLLEAWSRGVPVIASPAAVEGLDVSDNGNVLIAANAADFAQAAVRLSTIPYMRVHLTNVGRETLLRRHNPASIAEATIAAYREAIARHEMRDSASR